VVDRGFNSPNRKCSIRDFDLARLRVCPGKPGAGNPHAGFYLGGEAQGQPRLLPTDHSIDRTRLREVLRKRVNDGSIVRLIGKWLRAGVMEEGVLTYPETGVVQGGVISPVLANVYGRLFGRKGTVSLMTPCVDGNVRPHSGVSSGQARCWWSASRGQRDLCVGRRLTRSRRVGEDQKGKPVSGEDET
jgi:hypothetical protein